MRGVHLLLAALFIGAIAFVSWKPPIDEVITVKDERRLPADTTLGAGGPAGSMAGATVLKGEDVEIPPNFPGDVPRYPGAKASAVTILPNDAASSVLLITGDPVATVAAWYEANAAGWAASAPESGTTREVRRFLKPGVTLTVTIELKLGRTEITAVRAKKEEDK
jgi:hypothetical protein